MVRPAGRVVAQMIRYTVNVERDETMWHIRVPEISRSTSATTLDEVEFMARDLISLMTDQTPDAFELDVRIKDS